MKLSKDFVVHTMDNVTYMTAVSSSLFTGMVRGNETFGEIIALLKTETTEDEIVEKMIEIYGSHEEKIREDVHETLIKLREIGALEE